VEDDIDKKLLEVIHQSGFPFQIGVRKEIERTFSEHGWTIPAEEHHWTHPTNGKSGFIDLIAEHANYFFTLVIECKRVKATECKRVKKDANSKDKTPPLGPSWIFLTARDYADTQHRLSGFLTNRYRDPERSDASGDAYGWADVIDFDPPTLESPYCHFDGQDEKNPSIDRIADTLLPSVEAAASERLTHTDGYNGENRVFVPVIVTNATLYTCSFDAADVSMTDGNLSKSDFQEVPFIRYRKGLVQSRATDIRSRNFKDSNRQQQRSLLIVNAASLASTLKQLNFRQDRVHSLMDKFQRLPRPPVA
jgi:hypothetical protein